MARRVAVSTADNKYNPITEFDKWYEFDCDHGYDTSGFLARLVKDSEELPDKINNMALEEAIDEMVRMQVGPAEYIKVVVEE